MTTLRKRRGIWLGAALLLCAGACRSNEQGIPEAQPPLVDPTRSPDAGAATDPGPPAADAGMPSPAGACSVGQVHCSGNVPQTCGADGRWITGPACGFACQGNAGCVNRFAAISAGRGAPTDVEGVTEFARNRDIFYSKKGGLFGARGFNVAVIDPVSGESLEPVRNFDPWDSRLTGSALDDLADYLRALEPGRLVLLSTCDDAGITKLDSCEKLDSAPAKRLIETLTALGSQEIARYCYRGAWSFVGIIGQSQPLAEKLSAGTKVTAEVMLPAR